MKQKTKDSKTEEGNVANNVSNSEWMPSFDNPRDVLNKQNSNVSNKTNFNLFKCVIDEWKKNARKTSDNITMSEFTVTKGGKRYYDGQVLNDGRNVKFGEEKHNDIEIANWFKKNIWKDVEFQQRIDFPQGIRTTDLVLTKPYPLLNDQTIEIKNSHSKNISSIFKKIKESNGDQSSNILYDGTELDFSEDEILREFENAYKRFNWLDTCLIKKNDRLLFALKRAK